MLSAPKIKNGFKTIKNFTFKRKRSPVLSFSRTESNNKKAKGPQ